jgi:hypothetical protein
VHYSEDSPARLLRITQGMASHIKQQLSRLLVGRDLAVMDFKVIDKSVQKTSPKVKNMYTFMKSFNRTFSCFGSDERAILAGIYKRPESIHLFTPIHTKMYSEYTQKSQGVQRDRNSRVYLTSPVC